LVVDGNGVAVVPREDAPDILAKAWQLLATEHILQEKIRAGATIGELINVDEVFGTVFAYQERATQGDKE
jgi:regulator of RNase E activity RraA